MERFSWTKLCQVAHTQPHHGFGCLNRDRAKTLLRSTERAPAQQEYCTCAQEGGKWPGIASTKTMDLGFNPTAPPCSTDSRQDRTDEQKKGPNIYTLVLKSQYDYIPYQSSTTEVELLSPHIQ